MKIAVFPGSFDPITKGHESIVYRALPLFDKIIILIANNIEKKSFFDIKKRVEWINQTFENNSKIIVDTYDGFTVDYCIEKDAQYILRGLRTSADFEFERTIAQVNKKLNKNIETIFILTLPEYSFINSSIVRDIIKHKGNPADFIPSAISL